MSNTVTRLFESFQPSHYQLSLVPDRETKTFHGTVVIQGKKVGRPSQRITLHQKDLKVTSARIVKHDKKGDTDITVSRINLQKSFDEVRLHTEAMLYGGEYSITLEFDGSIHDVMHGIYPCNYEVDGVKKQLIATQFESHHAREAFPCVDEPEAKATYDLTLTIPAGEVALSNTPVKSEIKDGDKVVTTFETTPKMSTYLLAFVYGDMQYKEAKTKDGVAVRVWATKAQNPDALDFPLDVGVKVVEFFNDYYGVPYPLAKCDHVALPDFSSAAMENWGLITYREAYLLVDPKTTPQSMKEVITTVIAHEISHQWFGNLVTMKWWDDLWLNESFANVMEYVATDALFPEWNIWNTFVSHEGLSSLRRDSLPGVQSVRSPVKHPDEIGSLFDPSIVYAKGGRLLNMLMNYLGTDDFRKGLTIYFEKHKYGNTTGSDLWSALAEASGKDVAGFMEPWLTRSGFPVVSVDQVGSNVAIEQNHFLVDPSKVDTERTWPVPLLSTTMEIPALLEKRSHEITVKESGYTRINDGASGHYIVHYKQGEHLNFVAALAEQKKLTPAERLMLLSDSSLLARADYLSFAASLGLLQYYADEDSEPVWDMISLLVADARRFIDVDANLEAPIKQLLRSLIQKQYDRLGWREKDNESGEDKKLRATIVSLGVYAEHEDITKLALDGFDAYKKDSSAVTSELRSIVFGAAVRNNVEGAFEYLLHLEETTSNPDLKQEVMSALTATKLPERVEQLLARIKDPTKVRLHDVDTWVVLLLRNRYGREHAWQWLRDGWSWIEKTFEGDKSYDSFPRYAASSFNTRKLYDEYVAFFDPLKDNVALNRNIVLGIEELDSRVKWLERDVDSVRDFFANA
jgi:aminopeptidase N